MSRIQKSPPCFGGSLWTGSTIMVAALIGMPGGVPETSPFYSETIAPLSILWQEREPSTYQKGSGYPYASGGGRKQDTDRKAGGARASTGAAWYIIEDLVKDLNVSKASNVKASRGLVAAKSQAVPLLLDELESVKDRTDMEHATRAIRVLRAMKSSAGVPACKKILLDTKLSERIQSRHALLSEAVAYISDNFNAEKVRHSEMARDTFIQFVMKHRDKYLVKTYYRTHWGPGKYIENIQVDVVYGVPLLIKSGDPRAKKVLMYLLKTLRPESYGRVAVTRLDEDGYTIASKPFAYKSLTGR
ncbi:hypothetical protein ACFLQU_05240 [Verrucomicrobiota bacterium]